MRREWRRLPAASAVNGAPVPVVCPAALSAAARAALSRVGPTRRARATAAGAERDVTHVVALVLHAPVVPEMFGQVSRSRLVGGQRRDAEAHLFLLPGQRAGRLAPA